MWNQPKTFKGRAGQQDLKGVFVCVCVWGGGGGGVCIMNTII